MKIIVGLGNPGEKHAKTRHNAGFMVLEEISSQVSGVRFQKREKLKAEICWFTQNALLVKPQTFMNNSGQAVKLLTKTYNLKPENLWVIHDDMDLELGRIKIHKGGSSGHHGIDSIIEEIDAPDFLKFRLGIGRPQDREDIDYLLSPFTKEELIMIKPAIKKMAGAVIMALEEGIDKAMNEFNK